MLSVAGPFHTINLFRTSWHGRDSIGVDNARPRFSILNTYYAKPVTEAAY